MGYLTDQPSCWLDIKDPVIIGPELIEKGSKTSGADIEVHERSSRSTQVIC